MTYPTWAYKLIRADLTLGATVYKFFGMNKIADGLNAQITANDDLIRQGKQPQIKGSFFVISVIILVVVVYFFRKSILKFIKKNI